MKELDIWGTLLSFDPQRWASKLKHNDIYINGCEEHWLWFKLKMARIMIRMNKRKNLDITSFYMISWIMQKLVWEYTTAYGN